jgi:hypothetical protein
MQCNRRRRPLQQHNHVEFPEQLDQEDNCFDFDRAESAAEDRVYAGASTRQF